MARKIYDILPPKIAHKIEHTIEGLSGDAQKEKNQKRGKTHYPKRYFNKRRVLVAGFLIVFLVGIYLYNSLQKASIEISPKMDNLTLQEKITADKSANEIDLQKKVIPAQYIEIQKDFSQEFPATGMSSSDSKASGNITIYNKINPVSPITLVKGTHFLSDSGKYFVTLNKVTIPAAKSQGGKIVPGSIVVKVQAEAVGSDQNIGPSKFSVPKLSGTAYYYSVWAESDSKMAGGSTGNVKKVTKDDIEEAKNTLTKDLFNQAENSLKESLSAGDILLDGATSKIIVSASSDVEPDSLAEKFNESVKVKISALIFKNEDLEKFAKDNILSGLQNGKSLLEQSLNISYSPELIDIKKGTETINLQLSAKTYYKIDENSLVGLFSNKSYDQIKGIVDEKYGDNISQIKINFWPFWVNKAPKDNNKIKINLNFE